jgi:hypothetical protein
MTTNTAERSANARALDAATLYDAATLCEAFQISAATHPHRVARSSDGWTWPPCTALYR